MASRTATPPTTDLSVTMRVVHNHARVLLWVGDRPIVLTTALARKVAAALVNEANVADDLEPTLQAVVQSQASRS